MRGSLAAENAGVPTVSFVCSGFSTQGASTASGLGLPNLPMATYPGHVDLHAQDVLEKNIVNYVMPQIVSGLTDQPIETESDAEPEAYSIVFKGTFEAVNEFFYRKEWSDGLPIIPPTIEKIQAFLKFSNFPPDHVLAVLMPEMRQATLLNIAINGVMAGCRPEYMPVLTAMVEAMSDPEFGHEHLGHTPGTEVLITLNGPIIKDLGFNYEQGALRVGYQANTSIGRFWRLYLRNVAGFLPKKTDKATFGGTWRVVLAENEDALDRIGWQPMSVDQGFNAGDNVITISSCTSTDSIYSVGRETAERILDTIAARTVDIQLYFFALDFAGRRSVRPQILLSPCLAEGIARGGYSKSKMKVYLYDHARFPVGRFEKMFNDKVLCNAVKEKKLPMEFCKSADPDRLVPIVWSPDDFMITVSGDPDRDNCLICAQNGFIGYPVSKKIRLPENWNELLSGLEGSRPNTC